MKDMAVDLIPQTSQFNKELKWQSQMKLTKQTKFNKYVTTKIILKCERQPSINKKTKKVDHANELPFISFTSRHTAGWEAQNFGLWYYD